MARTAVREHKSQHEAIADLPLVTESATVSDVRPMDRDRREEVRTVLGALLADRGLEGADDLAEPADWERLRAALAADGHDGLARRVATFVGRRDRDRPMLVRARFRTDEPFRFVAGQYVGLRYEGTSRAYSIASSPNRERLDLCVRRVPGGRMSPKLCADLQVGDRVTLRGPQGELVLRDPSPRDLVFLATGTGVAPFKSMIDYALEEGLDEHDGDRRDVWLFLGAAWEDDLPYCEAFRELAADRDNFHFVPTLSREPYLSDWDGETDYVQHALLKHVDPAAVTGPVGHRVERWLRRSPNSGVDARLDPGRMEVYACGINAMVYALVDAVESIGVPPEQIESEGYG